MISAKIQSRPIWTGICLFRPACHFVYGLGTSARLQFVARGRASLLLASILLLLQVLFRFDRELPRIFFGRDLHQTDLDLAPSSSHLMSRLQIFPLSPPSTLTAAAEEDMNMFVSSDTLDRVRALKTE